MIETILSNIAKCYYPSRIEEIINMEEYNNTIESKNLRLVQNTFDHILRSKEQWEDYAVNFKNIRSDFNYHDVTLFSSGDRALNFQLTTMLGNKLHSICMNISILIPYYTYYVLEAEVDVDKLKWIKKPIIRKDLEALYSDEIEKMCILTENKFRFSKFPIELLDYKLPEINKSFIPFGDFTFFNAFFLDEYYTRL
ncbi:hypothetical protein [Flavobacterium sp. '19STA2R22 D10 B1']|uniref:hypothetical protein n=1 Tax=Flavobacterium aerium TaxID=3037261 RepID=UPI00278BB466|nr:hypothetical protein [Flavobacterium sp. '19STA2R22 D10 B1']